MMAAIPVYYELSWSILSTIGIINVLLGSLVAGITSLSPISTVPIVVSAACAVANGLCYYAFYANYSQTPTLVAAAFADVTWLIQEAGLSFYSYQILIRVLNARSRLMFMILFWILILFIATIRMVILVSRGALIREVVPNPSLQLRIDHLHVGYFITIAVVEIVSAFFLLRVFAAAQASSFLTSANKSGTGLFRQLIRSTEIRLATLSLVGITRAVTYSFQDTAQSATTVASQVDRFAYTLECMFPIVMMIDIMASKLHITAHQNDSSSRSRVQNRSSYHNRIRVTTVNTATVSHPNDEERAHMPRQTFIRLDNIETKTDAPSFLRDESV